MLQSHQSLLVFEKFRTSPTVPISSPLSLSFLPSFSLFPLYNSDINFNWFQCSGKWSTQPLSLSLSSLPCSCPVIFPQTHLSHSLQGHTLDPGTAMTNNFTFSESEFQAYCSPTHTSSCTVHSHWNPVSENFWCHQDVQATDLSSTFVFTVYQAHTWVSFHEFFIVITPGRWTQFPFLSIYLPEKALMKFNVLLIPVHLNQSLLKLMAIFFKWGP